MQERLENKNHIHVFEVINPSDRTRDFVVRTEDYVDDILKESKEFANNLNNLQTAKILKQFASFIRRYPKRSVSVETLSKHVKSDSGGDALKILAETNYVVVKNARATFTLPRVERFARMCVEGGDEVKKLVKRKSTNFARLPLSEAMEYKVRSSILGPEFHISDLCGKGIVER